MESLKSLAGKFPSGMVFPGPNGRTPKPNKTQQKAAEGLKAVEFAHVSLVGNWNVAVPALRAYLIPGDDEKRVLADAEAFAVPTEGTGTVPDLAARQQPGANDNDTSVQDLYGGNDKSDSAFGDRRKTKLNLTDKDKAGMKTAGADPEVQTALDNRAAAEKDVEASRWGLESAGHEVSSAASGVEAAFAGVDLDKAKKKLKLKDESLASLKAAQAAGKAEAAKIIGYVSSIAKIGAAAATGNAPGAVKEGVGMLDNVYGDLVDHAVDSQFAARIQAATASLNASKERIRALGATAAASRLDSADSALLGKVQLLDAAQQKHKTAQTNRRSAYKALAALVRKKSGSDPQTAKRLEAAVAAIPVVQSVTSRCKTAIGSLTTVGASADAQIGFAQVASTAGGAQMTNITSWMMTGRFELTGEITMWSKRLGELQKVIAGLRAGNTRVSGNRL